MATAASISARLLLDSTDYKKGLTEAGAHTKRFESQLNGIGSKLSSIGTTMSAAFTLPIVAGATMAGKAFTDLDTQMRNIQSISLQDEASLEVLRQKFIQMSTDQNVTRDSAKGLAEAYYFIQSAGFAGADGMTVLEVATRAATAGLTTTQTAGNAIIATLNAYGMGADQAGRVSDVLFKTVDMGVLTFEELATQLGDVVSTAAMTETSIEDVGAALVMMTRKGVSAPEAVTALNQLLLQFISPSQKMKDAAEGMGVSLDVTTLRTKGLAGALQEIIEKGGGTDALLTLFGDNVRALKGALTIAGEGTSEFMGIQEQFGDVTGRTQEAFLTQNKSVAAQMDNFKNKVTALGITLAGIFIPWLIKGVDAIKPLIDWLQNASPTTQKWIVIILALVAVIGPLLLVLGTMATMLSAVIGLVGLISLPMLAIIAVILVLIAAVVFLYLAWRNNWFGIRDIADQAILRIRIGIFAFVTWAQAFFSGQLGTWSVIWTNVWNTLKTVFQLAVSAIRFLILAWQAAMRGDWYAFGTWLRQAVNMMWLAIKTIFQTAGTNLVLAVQDIIRRITTAWNSIDWNSIGANIGNGIYNGLKSIGNSIVQYAQELAANVAQAWAGFWGISSPSSLAEYYATMVGEGWQQGLMNSDMTLQPAFATNAVGMPTADLTTGAGSVTSSSDAIIIDLLRQIAAKSAAQDPVALARALGQEISKLI